MLIKVCGITRAEDGIAAHRAGANLLGLICVKKSPRFVSVEQAKSIIEKIGTPELFVPVFVNEELPEMIQILESLGVGWVQLHGEEPVHVAHELQDRGFEVIKAVRVKSKSDIEKYQEYPADYLMFDTYSPGAHGGTGKTFDWSLLNRSQIHHAFFLSGGLNKENIKEAVSTLKPHGIDISSHLESAPGVKDPEKIREFFEVLKKIHHV